ncbi:ATP-binding protein [Kitasatospora sp. NPDC089509]|uniref:ATP-binding protein n=1 Tax=Kitasatospora sp. NPDC089509 TaxID=3364079 RepID=UPI0037FCA3EC
MDFIDRKATYGSEAGDPSPGSFVKAVAVLVVGGTGAGKTALIDSVSDIRPLVLRETLPWARERPGRSVGSVRPAQYSVAVDFGRMAIDEEILLLLFGICERDRTTSFWDELCACALGAIVLVDACRVNAGWETVVVLAERGVPFVVAVNVFPGAVVPSIVGVRSALDLSAEVPVVFGDARLSGFTGAVLRELIRTLHDVKRGGG